MWHPKWLSAHDFQKLKGRWTLILLCFFSLNDPQSALPVHTYIQTLVADNARRHPAINIHLAIWRSVSGPKNTSTCRVQGKWIPLYLMILCVYYTFFVCVCVNFSVSLFNFTLHHQPEPMKCYGISNTLTYSDCLIAKRRDNQHG